jgi:hypothetical protein
MVDILDEAFSKAQKVVGPDLWERMPDRDRMRAVRDEISKMGLEQLRSRPLFVDNPPVHGAV